MLGNIKIFTNMEQSVLFLLIGNIIDGKKYIHFQMESSK